MAGCKSLTQNEQDAVLTNLRTPRDKALFILGLKTGFRISELLSLTIGDVCQSNRVLDRVRVQRRSMKGKASSREIVMHPQAQAAIQALVTELGNSPGDSPLFVSRIGAKDGRKKALSRFQAAGILSKAYDAAGVTGSTGTHSMRKTFAKAVHQAFNKDIFKTQKALGHKSILSTASYLEVDQSEIDSAVLSA